MRSSSPFGGRVAGGAWLSMPERREVTSLSSDRRGIEQRLKCHKAALLTDAAMSRNLTRVSELLADNADPNVADDRGRLPLHAAAFAGATEVLRLLLEARADANLPEQRQEGNLSLQIAAWQGHTEVTRLLVEHSANLEAVDERGWSALCSAASQGHTATVRLLLKYAADPNRAVAVTGLGTMTPLQAAAKGRHVEVAQVLKEVTANLQTAASTAESASRLRRFVPDGASLLAPRAKQSQASCSCFAWFGKVCSRKG